MFSQMIKIVVFALTVCFGWSVGASAFADVVLIVHPSSNVSGVSVGDVRKLFLGKATTVTGAGAIKPLNQSAESAVRMTFDRELLGKEPKQIKSYWAKAMFSGKGTPPEEVSDDAAVIAAVAASDTFMGYVDASSVTDAVKVVSVQ